MYRVFDAYLGGPQKDWSRQLLAATDSLMAQGRAQQRRMEEARVTGTSPSLPLDRYAGKYEDPVHGDVTVAAENGSLLLRWGPRQVADLEHWHFDTFRATWRDPGFSSVFGGSSLRDFHTEPAGATGQAGDPGRRGVPAGPGGCTRRVGQVSEACAG
jgi:hypothetical protein